MTESLRSIVAKLKPVVRDLRYLERDARGIEEQFRRTPLGWVGVEGPLEKCQGGIDRRFRKIVGAKPNAEYAHGGLIRRLLDHIDALATTAGVVIDCGRLERDYKIWTDDHTLYDAISHSRSVLAERVRLNADGSLRRRG